MGISSVMTSDLKHTCERQGCHEETVSRCIVTDHWINIIPLKKTIITLNQLGFSILSPWCILIISQDDILPEMLSVSIVIKGYLSNYLIFVLIRSLSSQILTELTDVFQSFRMIEMGTDKYVTLCLMKRDRVFHKC